MGAFSYYDSSIEGDVYVQRLSAYVRRNEEALANGLLCFTKNRSNSISKPIRLSLSIHHLYYISERIESSTLGVDVGPLNIKLDNPNHEPTFISFMANNARSSKHFDSETRSISSINSMKSIVSSASVYWRSFAFSKDPKIVNKDLKYLYSSFTKIPCLILSPKTKINSISGYEEYPCDTSVPVKMFKNLQVLEIMDYDLNEIFGWNTLSEQLRILIIKNSKISRMEEIIYELVIDDESGRSSFNSHRNGKKSTELSSILPEENIHHEVHEYPQFNNKAFKYPKRERALTTGAGSLPKELMLSDGLLSLEQSKQSHVLPDSKWSFLKQLTISEGSITFIPSFVFKPLNNLVKLNLSNNLLEELPDGLDQLINIKYLNFSDNYLSTLKNLPKNLKHLSTLNFNNNKLESLEGLENLYVLEKIDLRKNNLKNIKDLKPVVLQFIKNPNKFDNVYLSSNKLPKNFRTDLFNLFNGVKYKNNIKIDDSKPGYFESALLLDAEGAFRVLEKFFNGADKQDSPSNRSSTYKSNESTDALTEPLKNFNLKEEDHQNSSKTNPKKKNELFEEIPKTFNADGSIASISKLQSPPLTPNRNLANKSDLLILKSRLSPMSTSADTSSATIPSHKNNLRRSTTLTQIDLDASAVNNTAPNILTTVQVTARMNT